MNYSVILSIAKTHLFSRKRQTIVAALGVTFGIGSYIIMMGFMNGLNGLLDGLILNRTPHIHIYNEIAPSKSQPIENSKRYEDAHAFVHSVKPKKNQVRISNALAIMDHLNSLPQVKRATTMVKAQAFYLGGSTRLNSSIIGIIPEDEVELYSLDDYIIEGSPFELKTYDNGILLGKGVADKLALIVGDVIQISTIYGEIYPLKIVGIFQSGLADIDNVQSYVNIKTAQRLMGESSNYITDINIRLFDMLKAPEMSKNLELKFGVTAVDIQSANAQFETGSYVRNLISYAVSIALLIVAGFGIYNILNMLIYEKMNDIAILKATGFSGKDVRRIFISQALIIGLMGGALGLVIGYIVSVIIDNTPFETAALPTIETYPVTFELMYYIIGFAFALISTFFAGYFPSKKAGRIDPVEIIRGQ